MTWLIFALMTVAAWGLYGVFLFKGGEMMKGPGVDPDTARIKAFLFIGLAYFLTAVLLPLAMLAARKASWNFPSSGMVWSLIAGIAGAAGAFCVLLAFGARGKPPEVMAIVFGGAPVVNSIVAITFVSPPGAWGRTPWQFYLGIVFAAVGAALVTLYRPAPAIHAPAGAPAHAAVAPAPQPPLSGNSAPQRL